MRIEPIQADASRRGFRRMAARIVYERRRFNPETLWFDAPEEYAGAGPAGDSWLLALLPLAFQMREPLEIELPVDARLLRNAAELLAIWQRWFPKFKPVEITAPPAASSTASAGKIGLFFTGGVDSFYSLLHFDETFSASHSTEPRRVDDLIYVCGYDIRLSSPAALERKTGSLVEVARTLGKNLVTIETNLRETRIGLVDWGLMMHGLALGAAGLILGARYSSLLISGEGLVIEGGTPWGSHALTNPLMSTSRTRVLRYADAVTRIEKTGFIAHHPVAMEHLHVCWKDGSNENCGHCEKCLRTLITLELLGAREKARRFADADLGDALRKLRVENRLAIPLWEELERAASANGRSELAQAIGRCLADSRKRNADADRWGFLNRMERRMRGWRKGVSLLES